MKHQVLVLAVGAAVLAGCFRPDDRKITVAVPQMKSQACADLIVAALPRNPSGKVLKRDLRKPYWEGHERTI